jgi:hypothetical protein
MVLPLKIQVTGPWYWVAGGRIGFLTKAEVIPDEGQKETVTGEFDKMDAGIVSGFEVSITENLACFATADIGIHDITNNGETYNFSLTGGLNYRWRK